MYYLPKLVIDLCIATLYFSELVARIIIYLLFMTVFVFSYGAVSSSTEGINLIVLAIFAGAITIAELITRLILSGISSFLDNLSQFFRNLKATLIAKNARKSRCKYSMYLRPFLIDGNLPTSSPRSYQTIRNFYSKTGAPGASILFKPDLADFELTLYKATKSAAGMEAVTAMSPYSKAETGIPRVKLEKEYYKNEKDSSDGYQKWQEVVSFLSEHSDYIVLIPYWTSGTIWEIDMILSEDSLMKKTVFVIPPRDVELIEYRKNPNAIRGKSNRNIFNRTYWLRIKRFFHERGVVFDVNDDGELGYIFSLNYDLSFSSKLTILDQKEQLVTIHELSRKMYQIVKTIKSKKEVNMQLD